jgi:Flp pilus assembly pilin Flp
VSVSKVLTPAKKERGGRMGGPRHWRCVLLAVELRLASDEGQVLIEYALILALISLASIGVLRALGVDLAGLLDQGSARMSSVTNP